MRGIAHELGSTTGVLTHYFRDKEALLAFVFEAIIARLDLDTLADPKAMESMDQARSILANNLPTSAETDMWWRVWLAFTAAALPDRRQSAKHAELYARMRDIWANVLAELQRSGAISADLDPVIEADCLLSLIDGVGVQALISPDVFTPTHQLSVLDAYLRKLRPV